MICILEYIRSWSSCCSTATSCARTNFKSVGGGACPSRSARKKWLVPPPSFYGSRNTISRFRESFRDGQHTLVSLLFAPRRTPCPAICKGGLGRLATWHLPGGPVGPESRWAATSNVEVGQTTYPVNRERVGRERREGSEGQSHKRKEREGGSGTGEGALSYGGRALLGYLCDHPPPSRVPSYATAVLASLPTWPGLVRRSSPPLAICKSVFCGSGATDNSILRERRNLLDGKICIERKTVEILQRAGDLHESC